MFIGRLPKVAAGRINARNQRANWRQAARARQTSVETDMTSPLSLSVTDTVPPDGWSGTLGGRAWVPAANSMPAGPAVVVLRADGVFDISDAAPTISSLLEREDPVATVRAASGRWIGKLETIIGNTADATGGTARNRERVHLLAPCDLQVIKAAGVTFAASLIERVIEEQAKGDPQGAVRVREQIRSLVGDSLTSIRPDSAEARELKALLIEQGLCPNTLKSESALTRKSSQKRQCWRLWVQA